ncbi:hypothetical protein NKY66_28775 [Sinorhizobium meliloti]|uniref:hypothetical protein n=1 Tax=Rhizobium meliloti TaxID=382 RepID=UPI003D657DA7
MMELDEENGGWVPLDCVLDGGPAARAAIGLIVLANDTVIEPEVRRFLPLPGVEVYSSRIPMAREVSPECLAAMAGELPRAVELLMPEHRLDDTGHDDRPLQPVRRLQCHDVCDDPPIL